MKLLALDTSSIACSAALQLDELLIERHEEQAREHTQLLMPMIESLLHEAGVTSSELDAIVLGNGPGSFIGMRIAASVAQGLAFGSGLNIIPVSSLAAIAAQVFAEREATEVIVAQDAHMHEVYLGIYEAGDSRLPVAVFPERLHGTDRIAELGSAAYVAAGAGWQRYPDLLAANRENLGDISDVLHPRATHLLRLGSAALREGHAVEPQDIVPAYLRQKVAQKPAPVS